MDKERELEHQSGNRMPGTAVNSLKAPQKDLRKTKGHIICSITNNQDHHSNVCTYIGVGVLHRVREIPWVYRTFSVRSSVRPNWELNIITIAVFRR